MGFKTIISPIAQEHIDAAITYYQDEVSNPVAEAFYNELQACYKILSLNPYFQIRTKTYRALPLKGFPYLLFFEIDETEKLVRILAVFNTNQDTQKWP